MNTRESEAAILLVDDDPAAVRTLLRELERLEAPYHFISAHTAEEALFRAKSESPSAAILDLTLNPEQGPQSGLQLISEIQKADPSIRILVLTGHGPQEVGLEAIRMGASSFLQKPANPEDLLSLLKDAVTFSGLLRRQFENTPSAEHIARLTGLSSQSPCMKKVLETIAYAASHSQPVLLTGETGTGKGLIAQTIHKASGRAKHHFVRYQPGYSTNDLTASELFGHKKGAFTGAHEDRRGLVEEAHLGTLLIDEVDELPNETQVLLLNVLQEKSFRRIGANREQKSDFRLISASNRNVDKAVSDGTLRQDFFHRIAHLRIEVPPLRDRSADIPSLANDFLTATASRENLAVSGITSDALSKLSGHNWPGNIRELQAVVEGGVFRAEYEKRQMIQTQDLEFSSPSATSASNGTSFREQVQGFENALAQEALQKHDGNQSKAAASLQLDRSSFRRILSRKS